MSYEKMNKQIIAAVGGEDNIQSVVHCATRLSCKKGWTISISYWKHRRRCLQRFG